MENLKFSHQFNEERLNSTPSDLPLEEDIFDNEESMFDTFDPEEEKQFKELSRLNSVVKESFQEAKKIFNEAKSKNTELLADTEEQIVEDIRSKLHQLILFADTSGDDTIVKYAAIDIEESLNFLEDIEFTDPKSAKILVEQVFFLKKLVENSIGSSKDLSAISPFSAVIKYGSLTQQEEAFDFIEKHIHILLENEAIENWNASPLIMRTVQTILRFGDPKRTPETFLTLLKLLDKKSDQEIEEVSYFFSRLPFVLANDEKFHYDNTMAVKTKTLLGVKLANIGIEPVKVLNIWYRYEKTMEDEVLKNLQNVLKLEAKHPGSIKNLRESYGITHFGRYPSELLEDMIENENEKTLPYGIILYPADDWNGAFLKNYDIFYKLRDQLKGKYNIRVVECEDQKDVTRKLALLDGKYGNDQKISFAVIGGHGEKDSIALGNSSKYNTVFSTSNLSPTRVRKGKEIFVENPSLILVSCSTGQNQGIGENLSQKLHAKVYAPDVPTNLKDITTEIVDGKLEFKVSYKKEGVLKTFDKRLPKSEGQNEN